MHALKQFVAGTGENLQHRHRFLQEYNKSIKPDKIGQWRHVMTPRSQAIFETVAGDTLCECGYPLTGLKSNVSVLSQAAYITHDRLSREAWYWLRRMIPNIPEIKSWM